MELWEVCISILSAAGNPDHVKFRGHFICFSTTFPFWTRNIFVIYLICGFGNSDATQFPKSQSLLLCAKAERILCGHKPIILIHFINLFQFQFCCKHTEIVKIHPSKMILKFQGQIVLDLLPHP